MANTPGNIPLEPAGQRRLLRMRIIAGASALLILIGAIAFVGVNGMEAAPLLILALPFFLPYVLVVWRLRGGPAKKGLALAMRIGFVMFALATVPAAVLLGVLLLELSSGESGNITATTVGHFVALVAGYAVLAWTQRTLRVDAEKVYLANWPGEEQQARKVARPVGWTLGAVAGAMLLAATIPSLRPSRTVANEVTAVGSVRTIYTVAEKYHDTYQNGYPPALNMLGPVPTGSEPTCRQADLIDAALASGTKSGYVFQYTPGPVVKNPVAVCPPGVETYTASARPVTYETTGQRSFFTDESGIIRATSADRAATEKDARIDQ